MFNMKFSCSVVMQLVVVSQLLLLMLFVTQSSADPRHTAPTTTHFKITRHQFTKDTATVCITFRLKSVNFQRIIHYECTVCSYVNCWQLCSTVCIVTDTAPQTIIVLLEWLFAEVPGRVTTNPCAALRFRTIRQTSQYRNHKNIGLAGSVGSVWVSFKVTIRCGKSSVAFVR